MEHNETRSQYGLIEKAVKNEITVEQFLSEGWDFRSKNFPSMDELTNHYSTQELTVLSDFLEEAKEYFATGARDDAETITQDWISTMNQQVHHGNWHTIIDGLESLSEEISGHSQDIGHTWEGLRDFDNDVKAAIEEQTEWVKILNNMDGYQLAAIELGLRLLNGEHDFVYPPNEELLRETTQNMLNMIKFFKRVNSIT